MKRKELITAMQATAVLIAMATLTKQVDACSHYLGSSSSAVIDFDTATDIYASPSVINYLSNLHIK